jgi:uncharacterized protein YqjF (DUF2071 family)
MAFRKKDETIQKDVDVKEFGIGSIIMMDGSNMKQAYVLSTTDNKSLIITNLRTFISYKLNVKVDDVYFFTKEEARNFFVEVRDLFGICATDSDGGWRSSGLKLFKCEYGDD